MRLTIAAVKQLLQQFHSDSLAVLKGLGGLYRCRKDPDGKRLGPMVGYAGTDKKTGKQLVGDIYANYAKAEQYPFVMRRLAQQMFDSVSPLVESIDVFLGAPEGGKSLADKLADIHEKRYVYPEKKVIELETENHREKSKLVWGRHELYPGERVAIVEDVSNNFSTTATLIQMIKDAGATPVVIFTLLNRSPDVDLWYISPQGDQLPVHALVRQEFPEYRQEDPEVAEDIARGNVVWKPKDKWDELAPLSE